MIICAHLIHNIINTFTLSIQVLYMSQKFPFLLKYIGQVGTLLI